MYHYAINSFFYFLQLLCIIVESESDVQAFKDFVDTDEPVKTKPESKPSAPTPAPAAKPPPTPQVPTQPSIGTPTAFSTGVAGRLFASPFAKKLAADKGIDLSALVGSGSGPGGRIRGSDVLSAPAGVSGGPRALQFSDIPLSNMRQTIAKRLLQSKQTIPHYYLTVDIEINELLR